MITNYGLVIINFICIVISCKCKKKAVYIGLFVELIRALVILFNYKEIPSLEDTEEMKFLMVDLVLLSIKLWFSLLIINLTFKRSYLLYIFNFLTIVISLVGLYYRIYGLKKPSSKVILYFLCLIFVIPFWFYVLRQIAYLSYTQSSEVNKIL